MSIGEEQKYEEIFPQPLPPPAPAAVVGVLDMSENGEIQSPVALGAASSASEPRLLWSAYRSFHAVKCMAE